MDIVNQNEFRKNESRMLRAIKKGAVFIYPTDTIYGLGCDATNYNAVKKIRKIKKRQNMPLSIIAPSKKWIVKNCIMEKKAKEYLKKLPGPYTFIFKLKNNRCISHIVNNRLKTLGIRIPKQWFTNVIKKINRPIVTTSVNITGEKFMISLDSLDKTLLKNIDFCIYEGKKENKPSRVIDFSTGEAIIKR